LKITVFNHKGSVLQDPSPPPLDSSKIHVWEFPLAISESAFARCPEILSEDERARAARFHFEKDARRFVVARSSMRSILAGYTNTAPRDLRFVYAEQGKPSLEQNAADIRFNLSHAGDRAILGVARGREIGVDIEAMREDVEFDKLAERFFSDEERGTLRALPREKKSWAFFRCWTCKEAFLKAQGFGLTRSLSSFDVDLSSGPARLLATRPDPAEAERWQLFELEAPPGHAAAAAVEGAISALSILGYR